MGSMGSVEAMADQRGWGLKPSGLYSVPRKGREVEISASCMQATLMHSCTVCTNQKARQRNLSNAGHPTADSQSLCWLI